MGWPHIPSASLSPVCQVINATALGSANIVVSILLSVIYFIPLLTLPSLLPLSPYIISLSPSFPHSISIGTLFTVNAVPAEQCRGNGAFHIERASRRSGGGAGGGVQWQSWNPAIRQHTAAITQLQKMGYTAKALHSEKDLEIRKKTMIGDKLLIPKT